MEINIPDVLAEVTAAFARYEAALVPGIVHRLMGRGMRAALSRARPAPRTRGNLFDAPAEHAVHGGLRRGPSLPRVPRPALYAVGGILGLWLARRL